MEKILEIKNLDKRYSGVHAVKDCSFTLEKGNIYGLLGPNGSGKSTMLGMVLNVINPSSGSFEWFDGKVSSHDALKRIGAIIESPNFYPQMSAVKNLQLVCKIKEIDESNIDNIIEQVHLTKFKHYPFANYSLGMKQRLAIASALLNKPEILILDEPTNGLDPQGIHDIRKLITDIAKGGTTILLASHLLDEVEKICDHLIVLRSGQMIYEGKVDEIFTNHGCIEVIVNADNTKLNELFTGYDGVNSFEQTSENNYKLELNKEINTADFNSYMFKNGIALSGFIYKKEKLEEQFLKLLKN